jgi:hypothetical protein
MQTEKPVYEEIEDLLGKVEQNERLRVVEEAKPVRFGTNGSFL